MSKRVFVYVNGTTKNGLVAAVADNFERFRDQLIFRHNPHLSFPNLRVFNSNGCEFTDISLIREADTVYVSNGEDFISVEEVASCSCDKNTSSEWITLNVGGRRFATTRSTLTSKEPESMLSRMFSSEENGEFSMIPSAKDPFGAYLIDRSPEYFEPILNYLRHGMLVLNKTVNPIGVLEEAKFFGIESVIPELTEMISEDLKETNNSPLTRKEVLRALTPTTVNSKLRFQGVNLSGCDLSRLDLRNINFKYASLSGCNLSGANLSMCSLERADLSHANMESVQLLGVKALCANMEGANLKSCNMEDPGGSHATLEGVNLKGANMEGSNMAGANLRVATLKNANLKNCDLRAAVLAGADLENCDLSGSDLQEANLRGANLKNTAFELMLTPLHMSQTVR